MSSNSETIILDHDQSTLQLYLSDEDDCERVKDKMNSKSWHGTLNHQGRFADNDYSYHELCSCRAEDFHQLRGPSSGKSTFSSTKTGITMCTEIVSRGTDTETLKFKNELDITLTSTVTKELELFDSQRPLYEKYNILEVALESLINYLDCLNLEVSSSVRMCSQINNYMASENPDMATEVFTNLIKKLCTSHKLNFSVLKNSIEMTLGNSKELEDFIYDYREKKADFNKAVHNFRMILESNFTVEQIKKLKKQFDVILSRYQHSRFMLDKKLPEVIRERKTVLINCFEELGEYLQKIGNNRSDLSLLFQELQCILKDPCENDQNTDSQFLLNDINGF